MDEPKIGEPVEMQLDEFVHLVQERQRRDAMGKLVISDWGNVLLDSDTGSYKAQTALYDNMEEKHEPRPVV